MAEPTTCAEQKGKPQIAGQFTVQIKETICN